jgi:uncharacterized protein YbjT (DUF2867 family)
VTNVTVLGATGTTGRLVSSTLQTQGHSVRRASRTSEIRFDWDDHSTWEAAVSDSTSAYVVADERVGGVERLSELLRLASRRGTERVVLLSARDWIDHDLPDGHLREDAVRASGLEWTILRPAWFAQNFHTAPAFAHGIAAGRLPFNSSDGATPFVDAADIAAVAAAALTEPGHHERHYELSGPRSLTVPDVVRIIGAAIGREVTPVPADEDSYQRFLRDLGYDDAGIHAMLFFGRAMRAGELDYVSSGVPDALGRPATAFEDFAAAAAAREPQRGTSWNCN